MPDLSIEELLGESATQFEEMFVFWLGLPPELRNRCADRFLKGMLEVRKMRLRNVKRAEAMIAKHRTAKGERQRGAQDGQ